MPGIFYRELSCLCRDPPYVHCSAAAIRLGSTVVPPGHIVECRVTNRSQQNPGVDTAVPRYSYEKAL